MTADYVISYGKSGGLGCFTADSLTLARGTRVVVRTLRGLEVGTVLCPASTRQAQMLGTASRGQVVRSLEQQDADVLQHHETQGQELFAQARAAALQLALPLEIIDVEILFDGGQALLQYLGAPDGDFAALIDNLEKAHPFTIRLETQSQPHDDHAHQHGGCGKPDCGRSDGGGCSTCGTGGCSSCGSGGVDMSAYFAHLRTRMEEKSSDRVSLL